MLLLLPQFDVSMDQSVALKVLEEMHALEGMHSKYASNLTLLKEMGKERVETQVSRGAAGSETAKREFIDKDVRGILNHRPWEMGK